MKSILISLLLTITIKASSQSVLQIKDFATVSGKWTGTLTYLDYTSNNTVSIPANTLIEIAAGNSYDQYLYYSAEPDKNKKSNYAISADGQMLNDMQLAEKKVLSDGSLQLVLESKGVDGNDDRPARFRHILLLSEKQFVITKMVKFEGEEQYFQRHEYRFGR